MSRFDIAIEQSLTEYGLCRDAALNAVNAGLEVKTVVWLGSYIVVVAVVAAVAVAAAARTD